MPSKYPEYAGYKPGVQGHSPVFGVEYRTYSSSPPFNLNAHNVPCAVCHVSTRAAVLMIPARLTCPTGWTQEYAGYLMTEYYAHNIATFECVDRNAEPIPGSHAVTNGGVLYFTEASCNGLPCPPYDPQKELTCVVCTK